MLGAWPPSLSKLWQTNKVPYRKRRNSGKGLERQPETRIWNKNDDIGQIDSVGTMMNMLKDDPSTVLSSILKKKVGAVSDGYIIKQIIHCEF